MLYVFGVSKILLKAILTVKDEFGYDCLRVNDKPNVKVW